MTTADDLRREIAEILEALKQRELSTEDLDRMSADLKAIEVRLKTRPVKGRRSILELDGLGMDLWRSIDVEAYIRRERDSWR